MKPQRTILVSGGRGYVGRFVVEALLAAGEIVRVMGRTPPSAGFFSTPVQFVEGTLDRPAAAGFEGVDCFVHAAFDHIPGKYRGGEGDDPGSFRRRNLDGTVALFRAARDKGVERCVFLSSRAVYGRQGRGAVLTEEMEPCPDTLYGEVKFAAEEALRTLSEPEGFCGTSLRITGVYGPAGPGEKHKWEMLFRDYLSGSSVEPRTATEVHGEDVAAAVRLVLSADPRLVGARAFNVSDVVLDRRDLLAIVQSLTGSTTPLPDWADASQIGIMDTQRLRSLGWRPGGMEKLRSTVAEFYASP